MKVQSKQRMYFPVKLLGTKSVFIGVKTPRIVYLFNFLSTASTCQTLMINLSSFSIQIYFRVRYVFVDVKKRIILHNRHVITESHRPHTFVCYEVVRALMIK